MNQYLTVRMAERRGIVGFFGGLFNIHKWQYEYIVEVHTSDGSVIPFKKHKHINNNKRHEWKID